MFKKTLVLVIVLALGLLNSLSVQAQQETLTPLNCGDIVEVENSTINPIIQYELQAQAGTSLSLRVEPIGQTVNVVVGMYDSGGNYLFGVNKTAAGNPELIDNLVISTSNPSLAFATLRTDTTQDYLGDIISYRYSIANFGAFTIYVGCTLRDGTVIQPGDTASTNGGAVEVPFSGVGFPGLPPMDFANGITVPFNLQGPNNGGLNPGFQSVFGFTFDGNTGAVMDLGFTRLAGNLNLGLSVLAPGNVIIFQVSLVTSDSLSTRFTLPLDGTYTIGVYLIDLLPLASPENTSFQVTGALNP